MMLELSPESLIVPYFVSGLAFFALGLAVALQMGRAHDYPFRRLLALLAAAGFVRAVKKWLDLVDLEQALRTHAAATGGGWLKLALLVAAFLLLAGYGLAVWRQVAPKRDWRRWVLLGLAALWLLGAAAMRLWIADTSAWLRAVDVWARYALGLPSSALVAYAIWLQRRESAARMRPAFGAAMLTAGWGIVWFGILDQLIAPHSLLWPSTALNDVWFFRAFGVHVQYLRVVALGVAMFGIARAMGVVEAAEREALTKAQEAALLAEAARRREAEEHTAQLSRLARELSALLETSRIVASRLDMDTLAKEAIARIVDLFDGVECGCILVTSPASGRLETKACTGIDTPCEKALEMADQVVRSGRGMVTRDDELPSLLCVPLRSESWALGVMSLANQSQAGRFADRELQQAQALANQVAVGMEKAWLYREVQRREQLLRRLLERVVAAQEEERRRIARELHDETGQALTALVTGLSALEAIVVSDPHLAEARLKDLLRVGLQAMEEIDRLIADLRPTLLDDLGLVAALRWLVESNRDRLPQVDLKLSLGKTRLPPHLEVELFRIAQESVKNIIRHANARNAAMSLRGEPGRVVLVVQDDGVGFDPQAAMDPLSPRPAWGLLGMKERAEGLGGSMVIDSQPGAGTCIRVEVPLTQEVGHESDTHPVGG